SPCAAAAKALLAKSSREKATACALSQFRMHKLQAPLYAHSRAAMGLPMAPRSLCRSLTDLATQPLIPATPIPRTQATVITAKVIAATMDEAMAAATAIRSR